MSSLVQERMKIYDKSLVEKGLQKGRQEGQAEGRLLAIRELAQKMLVSGLPIAQVTKITGLEESELKQLLKI